MNWYRWPWTEDRSYSGVITSALLDAAATGSSQAIQRTGAAQGAAQIWAASFAAAEVEPSSLRGLLNPVFLADMARELILRGNAVYAIGVEPLSLTAPSQWDVLGDNPAWTYRLDFDSPAGKTVTRLIQRGGVLHIRWSTQAGREWEGKGPLQACDLTSAMLGMLETRLSEEVTAAVGAVLPLPQGGENTALDSLRADLKAAKGRMLTVETTASGFGEGRHQAPAQDYMQKRFGADPPDTLRSLRIEAERAVIASCGIPPQFLGLGQSDGTTIRELTRRFLHGSISPVARMIEFELSMALDQQVSLSFDRLYAADIAGRARSYKQLIDAGLDAEAAARIVGIDG